MHGVSSVYLGSGNTLLNGTIIRLYSPNSNITIHGFDLVLDGLTVTDVYALLNGSLTPPSFILNSTYSYSSSGGGYSNLTGYSGHQVNLNVSTVFILDGVQIRGAKGVLKNVSITSPLSIDIGSYVKGNITIYSPTEPIDIVNNSISYPPNSSLWSWNPATHIAEVTEPADLITVEYGNGTTTTTSTITTTTIEQNIVCANTTTTLSTNYVFFDGFESGNFSKWNSTAQGSTGVISVTSNNPINGSFSEHVSIGNNINGYGYAVGKANLTSLGNSIWLQLFIRVDNFTHSPNKEFHFLSLRNTTSGSAGAFIRMGIKHLGTSTTHVLEIEVNTPNGSTDYETGALDILNNTVTRIELGLFKNATHGYIKGYVNGSLVSSITNIKTDYSAFTLDNIRVGVTATGNGLRDFNVTIDNVGVSTSRIGLPPYTCLYINPAVYYGNNTPWWIIGVLIGLTFGAVLLMRRRR